eukprot:403376832
MQTHSNQISDQVNNLQEDSQIPKILAQQTHYQVLRLLGEGTYGQVWLALDSKTSSQSSTQTELNSVQQAQQQHIPEALQQQKQVAIKVYKNFKHSLKVARAIVQEISILRQMSQTKHPNMLQVYEILYENHVEASSSDVRSQNQMNSLNELSFSARQRKPNQNSQKNLNISECAIVMEYIPNTLEDILRSPSNLSQNPGMIKCIMRELLTGLTFLHSYGIIHRDIKPANILITLNPHGSLVLKIIDFSISKVKTDAGADYLFDLFSYIGKGPHQEAPEVAMMCTYDEKIDIWGAGVIFAELLMSQETQRRSILFPARQCLPLSPCLENPQLVKEQALKCISDLVVMQTKFRETLSDNDVSFLESQSQRDYVMKIQNLQTNYSIKRPISFFMSFGTSTFELIDSMLQFNPNQRSTANNALRNDVSSGNNIVIDQQNQQIYVQNIDRVAIAKFQDSLAFRSIREFKDIDRVMIAEKLMQENLK